MIRAIYFDAVGTLIHPEPAAAQVYYDVARRHGGRRSPAWVAFQFLKAFHAQEKLDYARGWATSEARERQRWRTIVAETLKDVNDPEACFTELYEHFARPEAWTCDSGIEELLSDLRGRGYLLGIASNFDHRLHTVVAGLKPLAAIQHLVISSVVGWRKPAPAFFEALKHQAGVASGEILVVGDDRVNDYQGARAAGLQAVLVELRGSLRFAELHARLSGGGIWPM